MVSSAWCRKLCRNIEAVVSEVSDIKDRSPAGAVSPLWQKGGWGTKRRNGQSPGANGGSGCARGSELRRLTVETASAGKVG